MSIREIRRLPRNLDDWFTFLDEPPIYECVSDSSGHHWENIHANNPITLPIDDGSVYLGEQDLFYADPENPTQTARSLTTDTFFEGLERNPFPLRSNSHPTAVNLLDA
jgi:hypothetical protein